MKIFFFFLATIAGVIIVATTACRQQSKETEVTDKLSNDQLIKRGSYLVNAIGCDDCHSPKKMGPKGPQVDLESRLSGHPSNAVLGKADASVLRNGWVLFSMDLTAFLLVPGVLPTLQTLRLMKRVSAVGQRISLSIVFATENTKE